MNDSPKQKLKLTSASNRKRLMYEIESLVEQASMQAGFSDDERDSLTMSAIEAANNAIYHGNKRNPEKKIFVEMTVSTGEVSVVMRDEGKGFDLDGLKNPLEPDNLLRENGRGIFIIKSLMDHVHFNFSNEGTEIVMSKRKKISCV